MNCQLLSRFVSWLADLPSLAWLTRIIRKVELLVRLMILFVRMELRSLGESTSTAPAYMMQSMTSQLVEQLLEYQELRHEERELRTRVSLLEEKTARFGPLRTPVDVEMALEKEQAALEKIRGDLDRLESRLKEQKHMPIEQQTEIEVARLEQLLSDIKHRREQIIILQDSIQFLEERQAVLGLAAGVDLMNELKSTRERWGEVQTQLSELEQQLKEEYDLHSSDLQELVTMSRQEINRYARDLEKRKKGTVE